MEGLLKTVVSIMVLVVLVIGVVFEFDYFITIELGFHDMYIPTKPIILTGVAFIYLLFLALLIQGIQQKFNSKLIVMSIAITNFLVLSSFIYLAFLSYLMLALEHFEFLEQVDNSVYQNQKVVLIVTWVGLILSSALLEFFLIRKIVRLKVSITNS